MIAVTDLLISLSMVPVTASYFYHRQPLLFDNTFFCNLWGVSWLVLFRYTSTELLLIVWEFYWGSSHLVTVFQIVTLVLNLLVEGVNVTGGAWLGSCQNFWMRHLNEPKVRACYHLIDGGQGILKRFMICSQMCSSAYADCSSAYRGEQTHWNNWGNGMSL